MSNMRDATLTLAIDSRQAAQGAAQFTGATNQVQGAATRTEKAVGGLDRAFKSAAVTLGTYFTARMLTHGMGSLLRLASDAEEVGSKFNVVFADLAGSADAWASSFADSVGRAETETKRAMANAGDLFKPLGFAVDEAFELSKALVGLSVDVASFSNAMDAEVMRDFQSALVGNHETVRKYGIVISESTLEQEAFRKGLHKNYAELTDQQKVLLRYSLLVKGSADAQGDAVRTADSYANQMKRLKAALADTGTELGEVFLPAATTALQGVNSLFKEGRAAVNDWARDFKEGVKIVTGSIDDLEKATKKINFESEFSKFGPSTQQSIREAYLSTHPQDKWAFTKQKVTDPMGGGREVFQRPRDADYALKLMESYDRNLKRGYTPPSGPDISRMLERAGTDGASAYTGPGAMYPSAEGYEAYTQNMLDSYHQQAEARRSAMDEMAGMEQAVQREMDIIGRLSDSHAHAADMIEYSTLANERYGEGTAEAAAATAKFEQSIKRLSRQEKIVNMAEDISRAFGQTFADLITGAASAEDAFRSLGNQIIATMAQQMIADPIAQGLMGMFAGIFHGGGIVGETPAPVRIVNPDIFATAPRLHSGLRYDEYPAILQKGEQVIPAGQSSGGGAPNVTFNVTNQSGAQVEAQQTGVQWDGKRMVVGMMLKDKRNNGPMTRAGRRR